MTLMQLEVFVAIAGTGCLSSGADKSGITRSAAGRHIPGLKEQLGRGAY